MTGVEQKAELDLEGKQGLGGDFLKGVNGEEVVVGAGQVGRGHQHELANVASTGNIHHPRFAPAHTLHEAGAMRCLLKSGNAEELRTQGT